ncbi:uncharacterized protein LOC132718567 isoform X1 [Ruditapes philippinarum]|uniref:uncharacterized protein LOC132718567 isoform X1 n=1 Tax=Ruditapes philippinarum TaxID=129788 RepID=UPI00295B4A47|nr:uncharacterized protein LOC132718567 isoform X1 [Ruditapes philippinarum]
MVDNILFTFILFAGFTGTFATSTRPAPFFGFLIGVIVFIVVLVLISIFVCVYCRRKRGHPGQVCQPPPLLSTTIHIHNPLPFGHAGYSPVMIMTSNVTPGSMQQWQQPVAPPKFEEIDSQQ